MSDTHTIKPDFGKSGGLIPVIIQDAVSAEVYMLGYMNEAAWTQTLDTNLVTFYSRSRQRLWVKGESSGNYLHLVSASLDCDADALLLRVRPSGPVCHTGAQSCFGTAAAHGFLYRLEAVIQQRLDTHSENSYTSRLAARGINKVAQKVGEEAVELLIEAKDDNRELFLGEAADLLYHLLLLLRVKGTSMAAVEEVLRERHHSKPSS